VWRSVTYAFKSTSQIPAIPALAYNGSFNSRSEAREVSHFSNIFRKLQVADRPGAGFEGVGP
jgi:hypothetical protein